MNEHRVNVVYRIRLASLIIFLVYVLPAYSQSARIFVDGVFSDWDNLNSLYVDTIGDQATGLVDFGQLWGANDEGLLFLRVQIGGEMNLQNDNDIAMFIDTDNNPATGMQVHGIGAEL